MLILYKKDGNRPGEIVETNSIYPETLPGTLRAKGVDFLDFPGLNIEGYRFYVRDGDLIARPEMPFQADKQEVIANGEDMLTISGLPQPCTIYFVDHFGDEEQVNCPDGTLEVGAVDAGHHRLRIEAWPYMPRGLMYTAVPAAASPPDDGMGAIWNGDDVDAD